MGQKVLIIGIDGATFKIMDPMMRKGELPNIKKLMDNGTRSVLNSTLIPLSPAAWTSFATGCDPDKHGIFDFSRRERDSYSSVPCSSSDRAVPPLWNILSRAGKKVVVINVPLSYPVDKVNGVMISGFPTPEELGDFTYPRSLLKELKDKIGPDYRLQPVVDVQNEELFLDEMTLITENVLKTTTHLMKTREWDFAMTVFVGPDALGHVFYRHMDKSHPRHDPKAPKRFKQAIQDSYRAIDKAVGKILKLIDKDTCVLMMSDHGFGPLYYGVTINNWLMKKGYLKLKDRPATRMRQTMYKMGVNYFNLYKTAKALGLTGKAAKQAYKKKSGLMDMVNKFFLTTDDIDWERTIAYSRGNGGQILINLKGREPLGWVKPGKDHRRYMREIAKGLKKLKDPSTGGVIFTDVYTRDKAYPQASLDQDCADVLFFDRRMRYSINRFFEFGSPKLIADHPMWTGTHTHDGIFGAWRPGMVQQGKELSSAEIRDVAPTVLHIMEVPVPRSMDGVVLDGIIEPGSDIDRDVDHVDAERALISKKLMASSTRKRL